jgi:hypothetical protein
MYEQNGAEHRFFTAATGTAGNTISFTQAMTLNASGNFGIGTSSPDGPLQVSFADAETSQFNAGAAVAYLTNTNTTNNNWAQIFWTDSDGGAAAAAFGAQYTDHTNDYAALSFSTRGTSGLGERVRITSGGYFKASNAGTYNNSTAAYHEMRSSDASQPALIVSNTNGSYTASVVEVIGQPTGTGFNFIRALDGAGNAVKFNVRGDGNVTNTNGSYGTISDERLKQDIADAPSQWDDIKAVRFRKYRMKDDVARDESAPYLLGVVAQELEQVSPGLVDDGEVKTVKSSILLMKAAVALQEAMARIEQLEAKVAALESK